MTDTKGNFMSHNFDPFFDWSKVSDEMVRDIQQDLLAYKKASKNLMWEPSPERVKEFIESHLRLSGTVDAITEAIHTMPVMVHVAGEKKTEQNPENEDQEGVLQRCKRCGSVLHFWSEGVMALTPAGPQPLSEDDIPWWEPGTVVAKATHNGGIGMYEVEKDRDLESHEMECVSLSELSPDG